MHHIIHNDYLIIDIICQVTIKRTVSRVVCIIFLLIMNFLFSGKKSKKNHGKIQGIMIT